MFVGFPFETFMMALNQHSSRVRMHFGQMYSIDSKYEASTIWLILLSYLLVVICKTCLCCIIFRKKWDNIYERSIFGVINFGSLSGKFKSKKKTNKKNELEATPDNNDSDNNDDTKLDDNDPAIVLKNVSKVVPGNEDNLVKANISIKYNRVTVLYSVNEFECMNVVCKLCAGYFLPDSGTVTTYGFQSNPVRIAYILTVSGYCFRFAVARQFMILILCLIHSEISFSKCSPCTSTCT